MRNHGRITLAGFVFALGALAPAVQAAVIVRDFRVESTFQALSFTPVTSNVQTFQLTYDPVVRYSAVAVPTYMSASSNASFNPANVQFSSFGGGGGNILILSGALNGIEAREGTNDFLINLVVDNNGNLVTSPTNSVEYSQAAVGLNNVTRRLTVSITDPSAAAVPEPATWAMMALGLGLVGAAARRRKSGLAAA